MRSATEFSCGVYTVVGLMNAARAPKNFKISFPRHTSAHRMEVGLRVGVSLLAVQLSVCEAWRSRVADILRV